MLTDLEQDLLTIIRELTDADYPPDAYGTVIICKAADLYASLCDLKPINKEEFRKRRRASGHTQGTLAELLHVHRYTVSRWETGDVQVPLYVVPILDVLTSN